MTNKSIKGPGVNPKVSEQNGKLNDFQKCCFSITNYTTDYSASFDQFLNLTVKLGWYHDVWNSLTFLSAVWYFKLFYTDVMVFAAGGRFEYNILLQMLMRGNCILLIKGLVTTNTAKITFLHIPMWCRQWHRFTISNRLAVSSTQMPTMKYEKSTELKRWLPSFWNLYLNAVSSSEVRRVRASLPLSYRALS